MQPRNREIGKQRLQIPRRAALARHKRSCCEEFGPGTKQDPLRILRAFLFLCLSSVYLTCSRFQWIAHGESFQYQLWQCAGWHYPDSITNFNEPWWAQSGHNAGDPVRNRFYAERSELPPDPG